MPKETNQPPPTSHLFTVRIWIEKSDHNQTELRSQVQHVLSGETHYFRDWSKMIVFMEARLQPEDYPT